MKKYYLELQGLYKSYFDGSGDHHILKGANLKIEKVDSCHIRKQRFWEIDFAQPDCWYRSS